MGIEMYRKVARGGLIKLQGYVRPHLSQRSLSVSPYMCVSPLEVTI